MKVLFLDIDGVCNCESTLLKAKRSDVIDPIMIGRINKITDATGAKIVISSSWRRIFGLSNVINKYLRPAGLSGDIIGETPLIGFKLSRGVTQRGKEIRKWLEKNPSVERFVILDDEDDMDGLQDNFIQTSFDDGGGIQDEHVERAILLLSGEK
jgi:hypothetical protein